MSNYSLKRTIIGRLHKGVDLYDGILQVVLKHNVTIGRVAGIGAVEKATLAFFDQSSMTYRDFVLDEHMEIVSMSGNVSVKEGRPFAHIHVVLADEKGIARGGHLLPGTAPVFACEFTIEEFDGPPLVRETDTQTGLALWAVQESA